MQGTHFRKVMEYGNQFGPGITHSTRVQSQKFGNVAFLSFIWHVKERRKERENP